MKWHQVEPGTWDVRPGTWDLGDVGGRCFGHLGCRGWMARREKSKVVQVVQDCRNARSIFQLCTIMSEGRKKL